MTSHMKMQNQTFRRCYNHRCSQTYVGIREGLERNCFVVAGLWLIYLTVLNFHNIMRFLQTKA